MSDSVICPECGKKVKKESTFCFGCGTKLAGDKLEYELPGESSEDSAELPEIDDEALPPLEDAPPEETLSWEASESTEALTSSRYDDIEVEDTPTPEAESVIEAREITDDDIPALAWEEHQIEERESGDVREGMPFVEVEPPRVLSYEFDEAIRHVLPEQEDDTREAVAHLFPTGGRGMTSTDFIDVVVGKPKKVALQKPLQELELASCPNCGTSLTSDEDFTYPAYVFEVMGRARVEFGDKKLAEHEHERAIEEFEKAKVLFEQAENERLVSEAMKRVDEGYESMAKYHFDQAEQHVRDRQFEWAIVQFKKARELYMLTSDTKMRARCAEKTRESYIEWGRALEADGDHFSKTGQSREALEAYRKAAEKFREGDDQKRLKGLEKKILKA